MKNHTLYLKYYRELAGFSVKELALLIGVTPNTIDNYEKGKTLPSMDTVILLAHALGTSTDQLLGYSLPLK